jgi:BirA family biotin operon repressor/biotin-[acetyl-CoA-carboxylase] ligase
LRRRSFHAPASPVKRPLSSVLPPAALPADPVPDLRLQAAFAAPLAADRIAAEFVPTGCVADIETVVQTGSTNSDLHARARVAAPPRVQLLAALEQAAGRGRHGRAWRAPRGAALLFSLAIPLDVSRVVDGAVAPACGLAAAEALGGDAAVRLKWPNDLLLGGRKLGGVLCELALDGTGARTLVVGFGVNLWLDHATREAIGQPAAALSGVVPLAQLAAQRERWIGRIAAHAAQALKRFGIEGFAPLRTRYRARFDWLGRDVQVWEGTRCVATGVAVDVDDGGRLLVQTQAGTQAFASGEVSLRSAPRLAVAGQ